MLVSIHSRHENFELLRKRTLHGYAQFSCLTKHSARETMPKIFPAVLKIMESFSLKPARTQISTIERPYK